jgi:sucrose-6-phosphate hydrolase SacC (GH32 family)
VQEFAGRDAQIAIIDKHRGGWGHINVDHIVLSNQRGDVPIASPGIKMEKDVMREITITHRLLHFPIKNGARLRPVTIRSDSEHQHVGRFDVELADADADWWAPLDVQEFVGKKLTLTVDQLPQGSTALDSVRQSDSMIDSTDLYREPLRSQFHFSPKRGWTNDPNGLVFYRGEYHLFFQHNPLGWNWGNMHWGHATSTDLVHWHEHGDVLVPDEMGPMFSGSAVVDWKNTSGFGTANNPPLVLIYTAAGNPTTQCIAYSNDGRRFTKYSGNPVLPQITGGNRDPKVFWHAPTNRWVMVLYVENSGKQHSVHFYQSSNLRQWEQLSVTDGGIDGDKYLFECPDLFELAVDGKDSRRKWVLNAANSEYAIGRFDGKTFDVETSRLADVRGRGFYAAQTFSDTPDDRRIQIGWLQAPSPGMTFNQLQSIPCELSLRTSPAGVRLHRSPVSELRSLRDGGNQADAMERYRADLVELRVKFRPEKNARIEFKLRGATIAYDAEREELVVNDYRVLAPLVDGQQELIVYVDRTVLEVFASSGLIYAPMPFIPDPTNQSASMSELGGAGLQSLELYRLKSIWE